ncbi:acyl-CoA thioesterase [Gilvimarinus agarilyticus]|uniref:acyl-CoA thioesterase n=1 Tax=unclassified Gilvimarinus TaxID=2642066 RepID=UPI001C09035B|nr:MULTISPECIES: acyl-CoA thioesterase [unclassified Gilvimarinus]MBU2886316.1 acyl-CoA thioesterase [Gilvimarinus agarilyticus]MDO6571002.1 acyl-CoA thioesterase [Gilvimarinus sp. 2_MG-2023]MDO6747857.1 acyl-CoA thioesterase [Gilvimarinus sp. 1_MG-2023]
MSMHGSLDEDPTPRGVLTLQTLSMPADTNPYGDIFGGWLMSQMDIGGAILAQNIARGRVTTVAVGSMVFLRPVPVGATVSVYAEEVEVGRSSIRIMIEVWIKDHRNGEVAKVTEGEYVYVAIDDNGRTRSVEP